MQRLSITWGPKESAVTSLLIEVHEKKYEEDQVYITTVSITTKNAAKALGKPMGTYITIEAPALDVPDEGSHREVWSMTPLMISAVSMPFCAMTPGAKELMECMRRLMRTHAYYNRRNSF